VLNALPVDGIAAFSDRFKFGDGTLKEILVRYCFVDWPSYASTKTVELLVRARDLYNPSVAAGESVNLRLVFEDASEFRFSEPKDNHLAISSVSDIGESVVAFVGGQFLFDYLGLRVGHDKSVDVGRDRAGTRPCCYVIAKRCLWELLPPAYGEPS
jgi:hypothetical protein